MTVLSFQDFAQPLPVICILVTAYFLDRRGFPIAVHCLWALLLSSLMVGVLKLGIARYRPYAFMPSKPSPASVEAHSSKRWADTWVEVSLKRRNYATTSFPSGHSAAAFAYGLVLAWFYPRLRWLFYLLAGGCATSRFLMEAHWLTDCYVGALIGTAAAYLSLRPWLYVDPIVHWFGRRKRKIT